MSNAPSPAIAAASSAFGSSASRGLWLGVLGVVIFAITTPMTRLAVGDAAQPQLSPAFVTAGRAALAGVLSALWLWHTRAPWPQRSQAGAAVVTGVLPLATAAVAAVVLRQRPSAGFWACAVFGFALVAGYAALQGGGRLVGADALLLIAVLSAAVGYVVGARLSARMRPEQVICWVLVGALPVTLPATLWAAQGVDFAAVRPSAWLGFGYVALFSMWLGFFAWYRGLALGGTVRVSQVQLLQPFLSMVFAVPLLGERLDATTIAFALAVIGTVFVGRRMPVGARPV